MTKKYLPDDEKSKDDTTRHPPLATIYYYDIGDYLDREQKLKILRDCKSIAGVPWEIITPDAKQNWINHQDNLFDSFIPLGDKKNPNELTIFENYSRGLATGRDAWCYNFSQKKLVTNMQRMIAFYNEQVEAYLEHLKYNGDKTVDQFIDNDSTKIAWDRELKKELEKCRTFEWEQSSVRPAMYRPFCKTKVYFNRKFNSMIYQMPRIFPEQGMENLVIVVEAPGSRVDFSCFISDTLPDLHCLEAAQCFPFYTYEREVSGERSGASRGLLDADDVAPCERVGDYIRSENISDAMLEKFRQRYEGERVSSGEFLVSSEEDFSNSKLETRNSKLSKWDIFYYIYGILHCSTYRERFASDLKKQLPRIPFANDFWAFSKAGKQLADLHVGYEKVSSYELRVSSEENSPNSKLETGNTQLFNEVSSYELQVSSEESPPNSKLETRNSQLFNEVSSEENSPNSKLETRNLKLSSPMKLFNSQSKDRRAVPDSLRYNDFTTFTGIPAEAFLYKVNGRSPLEWLVDRYQKKTHKESGIENDPNDWCIENDNERYIFDLIPRLVTLSIESQKIITTLPDWDCPNEQGDERW